MNEFEVIRRYFSEQIKSCRSDVILGIGDDCAILDLPLNQQLAVSMDTLVSGVHFPIETTAFNIGYKSLAVNLSDLAAMGANPAWVTLALTLPEADKSWLKDFSDGFFTLAHQYGVQLIGGDTTRGPLSITVQVHGFVPKGQAVTRAGAQVGDLIYVTNTLGDAGFALGLLKQVERVALHDHSAVLKKLNCPEPRVKEGLLLRDFATAMIDISDGLIADLGHILESSGIGANVYLEKLPLSKDLCQSLSRDRAYDLALTAGDDYELCFTIPKALQSQVEAAMLSHHCHITCIGEITRSDELKILKPNGQLYHCAHQGYLHF